MNLDDTILPIVGDPQKINQQLGHYPIHLLNIIIIFITCVKLYIFYYLKSEDNPLRRQKWLFQDMVRQLLHKILANNLKSRSGKYKMCQGANPIKICTAVIYEFS
jgi:hypothetical protein